MDEKHSNVTAFLKSSGILVVANIALKCVQFFLMPIYTAYLSAAELGVNDIIFTTMSMLLPVLTLALDASFSAFYYDKKPDNTKYIFNTILLILCIQSVIPLVLCFFSKGISSILFGNAQYYLGIIFALLSLSINLFYIPFSLKIRMENRMKVFSLVNVSATLVLVAANLLFVVVLKQGYLALVVSQAITNVYQLVAYSAFAHAKCEIRFVSKAYVKTVIQYGLPLIPVGVFSWILSSCDRYMLLYMCGEEQVGLYGIGARFLTVLNVIVGAVNMAYTTFAFKNRDSQYAKEMYIGIFSALSFLLAGICFTVSLFSKEIVSAMTTAEYHQAFSLILPLLYSQASLAMTNVVGYGIAFEKKSRYYLLTTVISAIVNIVLNFFLVGIFQADGAAFATLIAHVFQLGITYLIAERLYPCHYPLQKAVTTFAGTFAIAYLTTGFGFIPKVGVYLAVVILFVFYYRKEISSAKKILEKKE